MNQERRMTILALLSGALAALALMAARRGFPLAHRWAARAARPAQHQAETRYYGYKEVHLS
jgi:hypothetical protein